MAIEKITKSLEADPVTVGVRLADDVQLWCPLFQRRYVWGKTEIDQLWEDIDTVIDGTFDQRFLGALVFDEEHAATASEAGKYWIIDGQQRLTSIVLSVIALAAHARHFGNEGEEVAHDLFDQYLVSRKKQTKHKPKLSPTVEDTRQFNDIMRSAFGSDFELDIDVAAESGESDGVMAKAYKIIQGHIEKRTSDIPGFEDPSEAEIVERISDLRDVLLENLEFVEIRLGDLHDPNEVFDRLNKEGVRLGILDLVRNEVLKRLHSDPKKAFALYHEVWRPFEDGFGEGESAKSDYFYPFALTVDQNVTKAKTFRTLSGHWSELIKGTTDEQSQLEIIMADLSQYQDSFRAIYSGQVSHLPEACAEWVERLVELNRPSSFFPFAMHLLSSLEAGETSLDDTVACFRIAESFLVRRAYLGIEPTGLHAVFKKLWGLCHGDPQKMRKEIVSKTVIFPTDEEFSQGVKTGDLYHRKICRYVLAQYELGINQLEKVDFLPEITADHVVPQERSEDWEALFSAQEHSEVLHTWGNLVPLSTEANSSKGSKGWDDAKASLEKETVFSTTKNLLSRSTPWDFAAVEKRSESLSVWALDRWPRFDDLL